MTAHVTPDGLSERVVTRTVWEAPDFETARAAAAKMRDDGRSEWAAATALAGWMLQHPEWSPTSAAGTTRCAPQDRHGKLPTITPEAYERLGLAIGPAVAPGRSVS